MTLDKRHNDPDWGEPSWGVIGILPSDPETTIHEGGYRTTTYYDWSELLTAVTVFVLIPISLIVLGFTVLACVRGKICCSCCYGKGDYVRREETVAPTMPQCSV